MSAPIHPVIAALTEHGPAQPGEMWHTGLTDEQLARARQATTLKRGLTGKALATWILTGDGIRQTTATKPRRRRRRRLA